MAKARSRKPPTSTNPLSETVTLARGDHFIALYSSDNERLQLAVPFLLEGLREGSLSFLIGPDSSTKVILAELQKSRPAIAPEIAAGRLIATEPQDAPRGQYNVVEDAMSAAERTGLRTFRLFVEVIGLRERMSTEQILELESRFDDEMVHKHSITAMCAYDVRRFSGVEMLFALKTHSGSVRYAHDDPREESR